jgi:hypothetical protein
MTRVTAWRTFCCTVLLESAVKSRATRQAWKTVDIRNDRKIERYHGSSISENMVKETSLMRSLLLFF